MELEPVRGRDMEGLRPLQPPEWPDIVPVFQYYLRSPFCTPMKVVLDGGIAGVGAAISLGATAWLAHVIVAEERRGQGIGGFIVGRLLELLRAAGCDTVSLIATDLGRPVYRRAGFVDQADYLLFTGREPLRLAGISGHIARPLPGEIDAVLALDQRISGEDRRAVLADQLEGSYVYRRGGGIAGYYLPEFYEGPVIADDPEAGIELMKLRYAWACKGVLPAENREGIDFLESRGFKKTLRLTRMVLGRGFPWRPQGLFGRISGNLG